MEAAYKKFVIVGLLLGIAMIGTEPKLAKGQTFCRMSKQGLKACLPSVSGENPIDPPTPACCSAISKADLQCFCRYKDSGLLSFYGVDPNQAMALPAKCKAVEPSFHC